MFADWKDSKHSSSVRAHAYRYKRAFTQFLNSLSFLFYLFPSLFFLFLIFFLLLFSSMLFSSWLSFLFSSHSSLFLSSQSSSFFFSLNSLLCFHLLFSSLSFSSYLEQGECPMLTPSFDMMSDLVILPSTITSSNRSSNSQTCTRRMN